MDIKQLIGETTDYDKKVALERKKPKSWCKSISAFANCYGGKLVFGVANDDELVGLSDAESDSEVISEAIKTHLNPIPEFKLSFEEDEDKTFVIVEVMKGQQTPYYYEGDGQLIAFMRIGNESVPATPSQLRDLVLRGSGESYDSLKSRYDFNNMSFTKLRSVYKQRTGNTFEDTDYESFGLVDEKGNLTNAGALLADESPVRHSRVFCTRWNGLTKASGIVDALDDKEYTGSLVTLLQDGMDFVRNNSKKAWRKVGDGRVEMPDYPDRAVLEGIVNALIHRSYMEIGSEVHIDMFDDRIEIYSPGGMVSGISLEGKDLLKIPSKRRNPILADIFSRLKYMERRGSGFKKILADYQSQVEFEETKMPVFDADNDDFTLILYNLNYGHDYMININDTQDGTQGGTQDGTQGGTQDGIQDDTSDGTQDDNKDKLREQIYIMIEANPQISTSEIATKLNVGVRTVKRRIKQMPNVSYVGSGYSGHWEIKREI
nr:ATP-binding protein [uncultured Agathobacter sp.]